jgi:hypothetical protein
MVGTMRKRIENSIERVEWRTLSPQVARDAVQKLLKQGSISKPTLEQVQRWSQQPEKQFHAVIAHPFVLIQEAYDH